MADITFSSEDEEFFGKVGGFGVPKFDAVMGGGVPRGFMIVAFTQTGSGSELFAKQFTSPAEEPENTILISTNEAQQEIIRVYEKYGWPLDIGVRTVGEEYNAACWSGTFWRAAIGWRVSSCLTSSAWHKPASWTPRTATSSPK